MKIIVLILLLVVTELSARLWTEYKAPLQAKESRLLVPDRQLAWKLRSNLDVLFEEKRIITNAQGFRVTDHWLKDTAKIQTYGSSSALGLGIEANKIYPVLLANMLAINEDEIKNYSQIGYSSSQGLKLIQKMPPAKNSTVIFSYGLHDLEKMRPLFPNFSSDEDFFASPIPGSTYALAQISSLSRAAQYFLNFLFSTKSKFHCPLPEKIPNRVEKEKIIDNLEQFRKLVFAQKAKLIVVGTPYNGVAGIKNTNQKSEKIYAQAKKAAQEGNCSAANKYLQEFFALEPSRIQEDILLLNNELQLWSKKSGVPFVSTAGLLKNNDFLLPNKLSAEGHRKIAEDIARVMREKNSK